MYVPWAAEYNLLQAIIRQLPEFTEARFCASSVLPLGGGDVKLEALKVKDKTQAKVVSMDNVSHGQVYFS